MRHDGDDGRKFPAAYLPDMQVSDDGIAIALDCPPNLGFVTINAFAAAQVVLIPIECKPEAWEAVPRLMQTLRKIVKEFQKPIRIYALPTFLERTNLAKDIYDEIKARPLYLVASLERTGEPLSSPAPSSPIACASTS